MVSLYQCLLPHCMVEALGGTQTTIIFQHAVFILDGCCFHQSILMNIYPTVRRGRVTGNNHTCRFHSHGHHYINPIIQNVWQDLCVLDFLLDICDIPISINCILMSSWFECNESQHCRSSSELRLSWSSWETPRWFVWASAPLSKSNAPKKIQMRFSGWFYLVAPLSALQKLWYISGAI